MGFPTRGFPAHFSPPPHWVVEGSEATSVVRSVAIGLEEFHRPLVGRLDLGKTISTAVYWAWCSERIGWGTLPDQITNGACTGLLLQD